jgi:ATP-binding cassette subfamily B protein
MRRNRYADQNVTEFKWHVLKQLWPYLVEFKGRVLLALACLVATKVASVYLPFILKNLVDTLNDKTQLDWVLVPFGLVAAYGLVRFAVVLFAELRDTLFARVTERAIRRVALNVFNHLHQLDLSFHLSRQTGGISRDIDRGTSGINFLMRFMVFNIVPTLLEIALVIGILLFNYGIGFAAITSVSIVLYIIFSIVATEKRTQYIRAANKADSTSNTRAIDSLINYETVKYFTNEAYEAKAYDHQLAEWEQAKLQNRLSLFVLNGGQALIIACSMTAMMALAAYHVVHEQMTIGDFVLINAFMLQLYIPLNFLGFVYREIKGSLANIEQMFSLLATTPQVVDAPDATELSVSNGSISFEQVDFYYQPERPILESVSFTVKGGERIAIVGASGAGKSTLVKLLFRFYDVTKGRILIDGQDIRTVTQQSLRRHIGIVPQDTVLFNDTLLNNVRYGNPEASDEAVMQAIKLAYLDDFIAALPDGVNTLVGERGLKLSGGEKQRVAIARTILKNPPILVFDEATSSLDSHAEQAILKALDEISQNRTSLVIAHRLSTVVNADNILVMQQGKIIEQGTHQQLLAKQGHYYAMWQLQQSGQADEQ